MLLRSGSNGGSRQIRQRNECQHSRGCSMRTAISRRGAALGGSAREPCAACQSARQYERMLMECAGPPIYRPRCDHRRRKPCSGHFRAGRVRHFGGRLARGATCTAVLTPTSIYCHGFRFPYVLQRSEAPYSCSLGSLGYSYRCRWMPLPASTRPSSPTLGCIHGVTSPSQQLQSEPFVAPAFIRFLICTTPSGATAKTCMWSLHTFHLKSQGD